MRPIEVSSDVFARIWTLRESGEDSEDAILKRVLWLTSSSQGASKLATKSPNGVDLDKTSGLTDLRFGVVFPEGFTIYRSYLGRSYTAVVKGGQWKLDGIEGRYSRVNELSRVIGTKTENAWANWFFDDQQGVRRPISVLRDQSLIPKKARGNSRKEVQHLGSNENGRTPRWCDDVRVSLERLGGRAHLSHIYEKVREIRRLGGRSTPDSLEEVVRKELEMRSSDSEVYDEERGEDWFYMPEGKGHGVWALR